MTVEPMNMNHVAVLGPGRIGRQIETAKVRALLRQLRRWREA